MQITILTPGSSALSQILLDGRTETAEVTFARGGSPYSYALNLASSGKYVSADAVAQSISEAKSAGAQFNQLVREGILAPIS